MNTDLRDYIPKQFLIGPYYYDLEITDLNRAEEQLHGECDFNERKIRLSKDLIYNTNEKNWQYTIEVLWHEINHAYNCNAGVLSSGIRKLKTEEIEEFFTDINSRNLIHFLIHNPEAIKLFLLFQK